jgi:hypothetical protein
VADPGTTFALWRYVWAVVNEIPTVEIVDITILIVINAGSAVLFGYVSPKPITDVFVIDERPVIEHGNDDRARHLAIGPRERACYIINPPEVTGAIRAVARAVVVRCRRGGKRRASQRATLEGCFL